MLQTIFLRQELSWMAKRVGLIVGLLLAFLFMLAGFRASEKTTMLLGVTSFVGAHLWLLAWLTFKIQPMRHHGTLVSIQIRWRENNKVITHFVLRPRRANFLEASISHK